MEAIATLGKSVRHRYHEGMRHAGPRTMRQHIASAPRVRDLQQAGNLSLIVDGYVHWLWLRHWVAQVIHLFVGIPLGAQAYWPARNGAKIRGAALRM